MPRIRRVEVERFRGIRQLRWLLPTDQHFIALIGPGDGCKTTILTAISRALSDSWSISFHDTDFYGGKVDEPIVIRIAFGDLDSELLDRDVAGLHLCGITAGGELTHDPADGDEACVVVELRVEADLEPRWTFYRPGDAGDPVPVRASVRARFRAFRVDDRIDAHLRWSRTSALGRLTESQHGTREVLLAAQRAASRAAADQIGEKLRELTTKVQTRIVAQGGGNFQALRPGLDSSLTTAQGNLALHEGDIPLTSFGLGTRRLVGAAIQQLAHPGESVLLVDELEHGLEPHRVAHLAGQLRDPSSFAQVIVTSQSPVTLQHLDATHLSTVRRAVDGAVEVHQLDHELQSVLRANPAAFLARHVLVAEGKTEVGIAMYLQSVWDGERRAQSPALAPAAALGVCTVDGGGGAYATKRAKWLLDAGYQVTLFLDGDRADTNAEAARLEREGVHLARWRDGDNTERALCSALSASGLTTLINLAVTTLTEDDDRTDNDVRQMLADHLRPHLPDDTSDPLDPTTWSQHRVDLATAQAAVVAAATTNKKGWFKKIEGGKRLGEFLANNPELLAAEAIQKVVQQLRCHLYTPPSDPHEQHNPTPSIKPEPS